MYVSIYVYSKVFKLVLTKRMNQGHRRNQKQNKENVT